MDTNIYLHFNGNCEEAFKFYENVLGGKIQHVSRFGGSPMDGQVPAEWKDKVLHANMTVGDRLIMGSDAPPDRYSKPRGFSINIGSNDVNEGKRLFDALADGGQVHMPFGETFWAKGFGMLIDKFEIPWMVNVEKPM
jgi:PhnB protein